MLSFSAKLHRDDSVCLFNINSDAEFEIIFRDNILKLSDFSISREVHFFLVIYFFLNNGHVCPIYPF